MPEYFRFFPKTKHSGRDVTDLTKRVAFLDRVVKNPLVFMPYTVEEGMKPEDVAYYYYDDTNWVWLIYLANNIVDPYLDWPLDTKRLEEYIEEKYVYACAECAIATTSIFDEVKTTTVALVDALNKGFTTSEIGFYTDDYAEVAEYISLNLKDEYMVSLLESYTAALIDNDIEYDIKTKTSLTDVTSALNINNIFALGNNTPIPEGLRRVIVLVPDKDVLKRTFSVANWSRSTNSAVKNIVYYISNEDNETKISVNTYEVNTSLNKLDIDFDPSKWDPVRVYDYEFELNESKRQIFLIDRAYKNLTLKELKSIMANG